MPDQILEFHCDACGKRFRWTSALAGKKVRCPCGQIFQAPQTIPDPSDTYEIAIDPAPPKTPPPAAKPVPVLPYQSPAAAGQQLANHQQVDPESIKNIQAPLWLIGGGICVEVAAEVVEHGASAQQALIHIGLHLILGTTLMFVGIWIASRVRQFSLGNLKTVPLRLAAISVAPAAALDVVSPFLRILPLPYIGGLGELLIGFGLYFALLGMLFDLDESDTWFCVWIILLVNLGVFVLILRLGA